MSPQQYAEAVANWAAGLEQQFAVHGGQWLDMLPSSKPPTYHDYLDYRVRPEQDPYEKFRQALRDGKLVHYRSPEGIWVPPEGELFGFDAEPECYRIVETDEQIIEFHHVSSGAMTELTICIDHYAETGEVTDAYFKDFL